MRRFCLSAAAVTMCSLGYCLGDDLPRCEDYPGNLHIFWTNTTAENGDQKFEIKGSSGTASIDKMKYLDANGVLNEERDRILVYDCTEAINAAYSGLQESMPSCHLTDFKDQKKFSLFLPSSQYLQLYHKVRDAVALWTDNDWERVCKDDPGYVYITCESILTKDTTCGAGWLYRIKGASGKSPTNKITRKPDGVNAEILEIGRFPVSDCRDATGSILSLLHNWESSPKIERRRNCGAAAFSIPRRIDEQLIYTVRCAIFQLVQIIPPIDWLPCLENELGYLYFMRVFRKSNDSSYYYCDKVFGTSLIIDSNELKLESPFFVYQEVGKYLVQDCAKSLKDAIGAINRDHPNYKRWKNVIRFGEECYEMMGRNGYQRFESTIWKNIESLVIFTSRVESIKKCIRPVLGIDQNAKV